MNTCPLSKWHVGKTTLRLKPLPIWILDSPLPGRSSTMSKSTGSGLTSPKTFRSRGLRLRISSLTFSPSHFLKSRSNDSERRSSAGESSSRTVVWALTHSCLLCFILTLLSYQVSPQVWSFWPRLEPLAVLLRLVQLRNSMLFELIGSTTQRECQPRGHCASVDDHGAGSECSLLIYYSHNLHSLFSYSVDLVRSSWPWAYASNAAFWWFDLSCGSCFGWSVEVYVDGTEYCLSWGVETPLVSKTIQVLIAMSSSEHWISQSWPVGDWHVGRLACKSHTPCLRPIRSVRKWSQSPLKALYGMLQATLLWYKRLGLVGWA